MHLLLSTLKKLDPTAEGQFGRWRHFLSGFTFAPGDLLG